MMQDQTRKSRYLRQASAIAASGRITRPFSDIIPTHAAVTLPMDGGYESSRVESFRYKEILSFASAYSQVAGSDYGPDGPFDTLAMTVIEGLNILDVVKCDRMVARISSKFPGTVDQGDGHDLTHEVVELFDKLRDDPKKPPPPEPEFTTVGTRFEGLRIGNLVFDELDLAVGPLCECTTWARLQASIRSGKLKGPLTEGAMSAPNGDKVELPDGKIMPRMLGFSLAPSGRSSNIK